MGGFKILGVILALLYMLICIMCHFFRSMANHSIKLKLSKVGVHSCVVLLVSVVAIATGAKNLSKSEEKLTFFVVCVILKCDLPPDQHTLGIQFVYKKKLPCPFLSVYMT